jgi:ribosomal protein L32
MAGSGGLTCSTCGTESQPGAKFCMECGTPFAAVCPSCGATHLPGAKFCPECGTALAGGVDTGASTRGPRQATAAPDHVAERRLVSVLFADIVGFTAYSEGRDAEDVRELQTRWAHAG